MVLKQTELKRTTFFTAALQLPPTTCHRCKRPLLAAALLDPGRWDQDGGGEDARGVGEAERVQGAGSRGSGDGAGSGRVVAARLVPGPVDIRGCRSAPRLVGLFGDQTRFAIILGFVHYIK